MKNILFIAIVFLLVSYSCSNNADATKLKNGEVDSTQVDQQSKNVSNVHCTIDGKKWNAGAINGSYIHEAELDVVIVDVTGIAPINDAVDHTTLVNLHIRNFKGVGDYTDNVTISYKKIFREGPDSREEQSDNGQLHVTHWDADNKIISGEFTVEIPTKDKKTLHLTKGQFNQISLKTIAIE